MKLYEKKCPNCGASLEFDENARSCKCEYCHRTFEIERENNNKKVFSAEDFNLNELKGPLKIFAGVNIIFTIVFFAVFIFVGCIIFKGFSEISSGVDGGKLYTNVSELSNNDYGDFDNEAYHTIMTNDDNLEDFHLNMTVKREKVYVAYSKDDKKNYIYVLYKTKYEKFFDGASYTVYVPIKYENLHKNSSALIFQLDNAKVEAPEYYLNLEHSEYTYGYGDIETFEKDVINPLKKKYKVSQK